MRRILRKLPIKGEFAKNALTLTIGTSIAQAFPILLYPVLGRIFTPAEFGLLATLTSFTGILIVMATGKYESSILITNTKKDAVNVIALVLFLSFTFLLISFFGLYFLSDKLVIWFKEPNIKQWLFIPPLSGFAIIIFNTYNEWCVRNKYFVSLSWNKVTNAGATTLSKVALGIIKITSNGLVVGDLIGRIISALGCIYRALKRDKDVFVQISYKRMLILAKRYKSFPR